MFTVNMEKVRRNINFAFSTQKKEAWKVKETCFISTPNVESGWDLVGFQLEKELHKLCSCLQSAWTLLWSEVVPSSGNFGSVWLTTDEIPSWEKTAWVALSLRVLSSKLSWTEGFFFLPTTWLEKKSQDHKWISSLAFRNISTRKLQYSTTPEKRLPAHAEPKAVGPLMTLFS